MPSAYGGSSVAASLAPTDRGQANLGAAPGLRRDPGAKTLGGLPWAVEIPMPDRQRDAEGAAGFTGRGLDPDFLEWPLSQDAPVGHAVERHAASQAQVGQSGFALDEPGDLEHYLLGNLLNRPRKVHLTLRDARLGLSGRSADQALERLARHPEPLGVREVLVVHPDRSIVPDVQ